MDIAKKIREQAEGGPEHLQVALLLGGESTERVVSLASGISAGAALAERGHHVTFFDPATLVRIDVRGPVDRATLAQRIGMQSSAEALVSEEVSSEELRLRRRRLVPALTLLASEPVDVAFSLLHGGAGESGLVNGVLSMLGVPYVGSDALSSAAAMDKGTTLSVLQEHGVPIAGHVYWRDLSVPPSSADLERLGGYPVVVKPLAEGSTVGITIVREAGDWARAADVGGPYSHPTRGLLVEHFVPGKELTVGMLGSDPLPLVEIVPLEGFYDFTRKYTKGSSQYIVPAPVESGLAERLKEYAAVAFRELGCRDYGRVDFRVSDEGEVACLEVNTIPGMTATSLLPMAAKAIGIEFGELCELLCRMGWKRGRGAGPGTAGAPAVR
ncbi:MAG: D-alanine--D-alanine ligase [Candidatus Eisenbacteria bacterium]